MLETWQFIPLQLFNKFRKLARIRATFFGKEGNFNGFSLLYQILAERNVAI